MLVRWLVTPSRLQKLESTGISRSLATSPSGKKHNRPSSKYSVKNRRPAPPGGWRYSSLKSHVFIDSEADPGLAYRSVTTRDLPAVTRNTRTSAAYFAGFLTR